MEIERRFREEFERLIDKHDLSAFDGLMSYHGYFDELPLFAQYTEVSFLDDLPFEERNRVLIRAAVAHLEKILRYSRTFYEGRDYDYFCAVTITNWEFVDEGDVVIPRFWYANPSHGVFDFAVLGPPESEYSRFVTGCLDHDPRYHVVEDVVHEYSGPRVERVFVIDESCPPPGPRTAQ